MGRELLEGIVLDRNANFMASNLTEAGFRVRMIQVLDDEDQSEAASWIRQAMGMKPDFILITGGMGPGNDDITRECVAEAAGLGLAIDDRARDFLAESYHRLAARGVVRTAELDEARLKMATLPVGSVCHENPIGTAPAVQLEVGETTFFLLPGQPEELRGMFVSCVKPVLEARGSGGVRLTAHVDYPGGDEALISRMLSDLGRRHPGLQSRARLHGNSEGSVRLRISMSAEGADQATVQGLLDAASADLRARLGLEVTTNATAEDASVD